MKKDKLHNIKSTGFKTPDNYFEGLDDKLLKRLSDNDSLDDIKSPGFKVPTDYFDSVEDKVFNEINNTPVVKLKSRKSFYYIAGIAASLVLMLAVFFNNEKQEESLSVEMVETYLQESDLDSYELAQLLSDANLLEDEFTIVTTPYMEDNLESYLLDNVDIESYLE